MTGGDDSLIKAWDYEADRTIPYFYQAFIGHTYGVSDVIFNPCD
jgi:WD40 repeat protein